MLLNEHRWSELPAWLAKTMRGNDVRRGGFPHEGMTAMNDRARLLNDRRRESLT